MATTINIAYQKKNYTLEFSRQTVKNLEDMGFVLEQISEKPMTMVPLLVYGAFMKHNRGIKRALVDEIYDNLVKKVGEEGEEGFIQVLLEMYAETVNTLTGDAPEGDEGNAAIWTVTKD